ncbi:hypothetical protein LOZ65_005810 [Ophidiomyces ophidiicola]|nr:hypothetical protein LOZ65_005810 [Ophidiomyces ophidiicola]
MAPAPSSYPNSRFGSPENNNNGAGDLRHRRANRGGSFRPPALVPALVQGNLITLNKRYPKELDSLSQYPDDRASGAPTIIQWPAHAFNNSDTSPCGQSLFELFHPDESTERYRLSRNATEGRPNRHRCSQAIFCRLRILNLDDSRILATKLVAQARSAHLPIRPHTGDDFNDFWRLQRLSESVAHILLKAERRYIEHYAQTIKERLSEQRLVALMHKGLDNVVNDIQTAGFWTTENSWLVRGGCLQS